MLVSLQRKRENIEMNDRCLPMNISYVQGYFMYEAGLPNPEPL